MVRKETLRPDWNATMAADLASDGSLTSCLYAWLEHGFAKLHFIANFMRRDKRAAAAVGLKLGFSAHLDAAAATVLTAPRMTTCDRGALTEDQQRCRPLPGPQINQTTRCPWRAEFTANATTYRPAHT